MKIHAVRGANLASLAGPFEVDFLADPLGAAGLFAITGPTGSGKSTLLDAICLALFGTTPRLNSSGGARIGRPEDDDADRVSAYDVRGLLHRGTAKGFAEVDFEGRDGRRYRARWEVRRARDKADGRLQQATAGLTCLDDGAALGGKTTETLEAIRERVGLTFDQFRRSVLLAQGDFAAFLHAKPKERAELLEKVTGTGIYAVISRRAYERAKKHQGERDLLRMHLERLSVATPEERAELERQAGERAEVLRERQLAEKAAEVAAGWFDALERLDAGLAAAIAEAVAAEAAVGEAGPRRAAVAQVARVQRHAGALRELDDAAASLVKVKAAHEDAIEAQRRAEEGQAQAKGREAEARAVRDAARAAREAAEPEMQQAAQLDALLGAAEETARAAAADAAQKASRAAERGAARAELVKALEEVRGRRERAAAWVAENAGSRQLAEAWAAVRAAAAEHGEAAAALGKLAREEAAADGALATARRAHAEAAAARDAVREALQAAAEALEAAERALVPGAREALAERRSALDGRRDRARRAVSAAADAATDRAQAAAEAAAIGAASGRAAAAAAAVARIEAALPLARVRLEEASRARDQVRAAMQLEARRAELRDGEPCPLCGAPEHPWARGVPPVADDLDARVRALDAELRGLEGGREKERAQADAAVAEIAQADLRRGAIEARLAALEQAWDGLELGLPELSSPAAPPAAAEALAAAEGALRGLEAEDKALLALERAAAESRRRRDAERGRLDAGERVEREAAAAAQGATDALGALRSAREREEARRDGAWRAIERAWPPASAEREAFAADAAPVVQGWAKVVETWRRAEVALQETQVALTQLEPEAAGVAKEAEAAGIAAAEAARAREGAEEALGALRARRAALLAGRSVAEARAGLDLACAEAERAHAAAQDAWSAAGTALARAAAEREGSREALAGAHTRSEAAAEAMRAVLEAESLTHEALRALLQRDGAWVEAEQRALQAVDQRHTQAAAVEGERRRARDQHEQTRPEGLDRATAAERLAAATAALRQASSEHQAVLLRLAHDDQARAGAAALALELAEVERVAKLWGGLSDVIGSADGSKFRRFAQGLTLDALLVQANHQLGALSPRYRLQRVPGEDLELQVVDQHMGDEIRAIPSLSGGESFLASLALALGLATLSAASTPVRSLFIDEGFGTLDRQTLETAMAALDALQAQGRQVGIISHVEGLAEHVGVQIRVERLGGGRSRVVAP